MAAFSPAGCCCGGVDCYVCRGGTAPAQLQLTLWGVEPVATFCCAGRCGDFNSTFTLDFDGVRLFGAALGCYYVLRPAVCHAGGANPPAADLFRVVLLPALGGGARLLVQLFAGGVDCPGAVQPVAERDYVFDEPLDCRRLDVTLEAIGAGIAAQVCDFSQAQARILAL